jgi:hypothetical protein
VPFHILGISLSSTEIPGVFNPGYSQRDIFVVYFLSFLRSVTSLEGWLSILSSADGKPTSRFPSALGIALYEIIN